MMMQRYSSRVGKTRLVVAAASGYSHLVIASNPNGEQKQNSESPIKSPLLRNSKTTSNKSNLALSLFVY